MFSSLYLHRTTYEGQAAIALHISVEQETRYCLYLAWMMLPQDDTPDKWGDSCNLR
jgi:hypothetical protein